MGPAFGNCDDQIFPTSLVEFAVKLHKDFNDNGTQIVLWWQKGRVVPAIYCTSLEMAYFIDTLFISQASVIGWRICPFCSKPFEQRRADQEYCSNKHGDALSHGEDALQTKAKGRNGSEEGERKMALKKRGNTWHADFVVDGQRYRQSLDTSDWREAQALHKELIARAKAGKVSAKKHEIAKLTFRDAAERFLEDRLSHLAERSIQTERERAKPINDQFGNIAVSRITVDDVTSYIRERKAAGRANATVNRELDIIRGVLKKAKRWHLFADDIQPLPVRQTIGRAMTYEEKIRLLKVAAARPEWQNAAWAATLALNTTMRGVEIKNLCWRDVDFFRRTLTVQAGARQTRVCGSIPLNGDAWSAIQELRCTGAPERSRDVPAPSTYVFPACEHDAVRPEPSRMRSWRAVMAVS